MVGFTVELSNQKSFILPPSDIISVGEEGWAAVQAFADFLLANQDIPPNEYL